MAEARPFASLSSGLLARKGAAKPAMRPQAFGSLGASLDDLGWDDMGEGPTGVVSQDHVPSSIAALTPAPRYESETPLVPAPHFEPEAPSVHDQRRALAESLAAEVEQSAEEIEAAEEEYEAAPIERISPKAVKAPVSSSPVVSIPVRRPMPARGKSAFTLRLDPDRHLRLRLACAVTGRSAQQIMTGALDEILKSLPEIDALAGQVPPKARARN
jgi:hypothetical protein